MDHNSDKNTVTIEAESPHQIMNEINLSSQFAQALEMQLAPGHCTVTTSLTAFQGLAEEGAFKPSVVAACKASKEKLERFAPAPKGSLAKAWHALEYAGELLAGKPTASAQTPVEGIKARVTIERYGLA